jgi:hypothetical protein
MRVIKWIALGIIVVSLILGAVQGFLLNNKMSKQGEILDKLEAEQGEHSYSPFYECHRSSGYTGKPIDDYWFGSGGRQGGGREARISSFWYDGEFHQPEGWGYIAFMTRESFYYPLWTAKIKWSTLQNAPNTVFWIGLNSGAGVNAGTVVFHMGKGGLGDELNVVVGDSFRFEITSLAPPDWSTAFHWYQIRTFPDGAEFFIDNELVALVVVGQGLPESHRIENGVLFGVTSNKGTSLDYQPRNWLSPYMRGMLLTEGGYEEASLSIPYECYGISDMSGDYTSTYQNLLIASLAGRASTSLLDCLTIPVNAGSKLALTVRGSYHTEATQGIKVHIYTSYDGLNYDSEELKDASGNPVFGNMPFAVGTTQQKTKDISTNARFVKVTIENLDETQAVSDVEVIATLGR